MKKRYFSFEKFCKVMGYDPEMVKQDKDRAWAVACDGAEWEKGDWMHDKDGNAYRCAPNWCVEKKKRYFSAAKWKEANHFLKIVAPQIFDLAVNTFVADCDGAEIRDDDSMVGKSGCVYHEHYPEATVDEPPIVDPEKKPEKASAKEVFEILERMFAQNKEEENSEPEPVEKDSPRYRIVIECDGGDITNAEMIVNGKTVRKSNAKRNPEDRFDFKVGAEYAFNRLFEKEEKEKKPAFKIGDIVRIRKDLRVNDFESLEKESEYGGCYVTTDMKRYAGKQAVISKVHKSEYDEKVRYHIKVDGKEVCWYWSKEMFEKPLAAGDRVVVQHINDESGKWMIGKHGRIVRVDGNVPAGREGGIDGHEFVDVAWVNFDDVLGTWCIYIERLKHE